MDYTKCHYYTENPMHFHGCPNLDTNGDSDECGECQYRLDNICKALSALQQGVSRRPGKRSGLVTALPVASPAGEL